MRVEVSNRSRPTHRLWVEVRIVPLIRRYPARGRSAVANDPGGPSHDSPLHAFAPGSVFSLGDFLQDQLIDREIGYGALRPSILSLKLFESLGLIHLHAAIDFTPAIVGLIGNTELLTDLRDVLFENKHVSKILYTSSWSEADE